MNKTGVYFTFSFNTTMQPALVFQKEMSFFIYLFIFEINPIQRCSKFQIALLTNYRVINKKIKKMFVHKMLSGDSVKILGSQPNLTRLELNCLLYVPIKEKKNCLLYVVLKGISQLTKKASRDWIQKNPLIPNLIKTIINEKEKV